MLTLLPNDVVKKSPAAVNVIWPTFPAAPLLNVADGVLEPDSGAGKNVSAPPNAPTARFPFASKPSATTLFEAIEKLGVELALIGRLYCWTTPGVWSLPTYSWACASEAARPRKATTITHTTLLSMC